MFTKRAAVIASLLIASAAMAQNAVTQWNEIAITAASMSSAPAAKTPGGMSVYIAYSQLAVYNAVNAIDERFEPYKYSLTAAPGASADAAAIEAAYRTLLFVLSDQAGYLSGQYGTAMAAIPDGPDKIAGQQLGAASASQLLDLRKPFLPRAAGGDGLGVPWPYSYPASPVAGIWIPTPPGFLAPQTPWMGQMLPFTFDDPAQFLPEPPPDLLSDTWTADYNQVKALGSLDSSVRTPQQTEIAQFWFDPATAQYGRMLRKVAMEKNLGLADSARMFAMAFAAAGDSIIGCYNAKYQYSFWRPITAIQNGGIDGNPDTIPDPTWTPLAATPPHPEYPSAHSCITGGISTALRDYFGTPNFGISIDSLVTGTTHDFANIHAWQNEVQYARIYAGFHFHQSVVQGVVLGRRVAAHMAVNYFRRVR